MTEKKRRGRPALSPEEKEQRRKERNRRDNERKKAMGYIAQKKYREKKKHITYQPKLCIPVEKKEDLFRLLEQTGLSTTQLFVGAVEEKYGVVLRKTIDKNDN